MLECPSSVLRKCESLKELETKLDAIVSHLSGWSGRTIFLDFSMLGSTTVPRALEAAAASAARSGIRPVPVVSLKRGAESPYNRSIRAVLDHHGSAICLRVSHEELKLGSIEDLLEVRLRGYGVRPAQVDLVIDRGGVDSSSETYRNSHIEFHGSIPGEH